MRKIMMENTNRSTKKSFTNKALIVSMIFHVVFLTTLFYFNIRDESIFDFQDKMSVSLTTIPKQLQTIKRKTPPIRPRTPEIYKTAKPLSKVETINPHNAFKSEITPTTPVITEQPRLENTKTDPNIDINVSTAVTQLREVEHSLSKTEAAEPTLGSALGEKRSGVQGVQRQSAPTTLKVGGAGGIDGDGDVSIGDIFEDKTPLPKIDFGNMMNLLANQIVGTSEGGPIDVVFVIDASGSMQDNIYSVARHLIDMVDVYQDSNIDYELGLTQFTTFEGKNSIRVLQLTKDLDDYKREINEIIVQHDEHALDAIEKTVNEIRFRATSKKHLILVTDEPFTSSKDLTLKNAIDLCREYGIFVNVLGLPEKEHQQLAEDTGGKWHAIPERGGIRQGTSAQNTASTAATKAESLRKAKWESLQTLGQSLIISTGKEPVDIILFIDGSKSMEDKVPEFVKQLEIWIRDWDNALIDYQLGVVRFRSKESVNMVNVYSPPQSHTQVQKIAELPYQDDEFLLHAIAEGFRKLELRENAKTHFILITDEPIDQNEKSEAVISFLEKNHIVVSVVGTYDTFQQSAAYKTGGMWLPIPMGYLTSNQSW